LKTGKKWIEGRIGGSAPRDRGIYKRPLWTRKCVQRLTEGEKIQGKERTGKGKESGVVGGGVGGGGMRKNGGGAEKGGAGGGQGAGGRT